MMKTAKEKMSVIERKDAHKVADHWVKIWSRGSEYREKVIKQMKKAGK